MVIDPERIQTWTHWSSSALWNKTVTWDAAELLRNSGYDSWSDVNTWKSIRTHHVYTYCLCTNNYAPCCLIIHVQTCRDRHIHMHLISAVQYSFSAHCCIIIISYTFYFLITTLCTSSVVESEWTCAAGVTLNLLNLESEPVDVDRELNISPCLHKLSRSTSLCL